MQMSLVQRMSTAAMMAGAVLLVQPMMAAADDQVGDPPKAEANVTEPEAKAAETETKDAASSDCENVQITVQNDSGQAIKLVSVDHMAGRRWKRGKIDFRTIDAGGSHTWTGTFKDMRGKEVQIRVNTRYVIDAMTERFSDLKATTIKSSSCASDERHSVTIGKP